MAARLKDRIHYYKLIRFGKIFSVDRLAESEAAELREGFERIGIEIKITQPKVFYKWRRMCAVENGHIKAPEFLPAVHDEERHRTDFEIFGDSGRPEKERKA